MEDIIDNYQKPHEKIKARFHKLLSSDPKSQIMRKTILDNRKGKLYRGIP
jgi:hypothetical protein